MSQLVLPVVSKHRLEKGQLKRLYMCPGDKTHGIVDITIFFDMPVGNVQPSYATFYLSDVKEESKVKLDENVLMSKVVLGLPEVTPELGKVIVGPNQNLWVELSNSGPVNFRVSGLEEHSTIVKGAGVLGYMKNTELGIFEFYRLDNPLTTYASGTLALTNLSEDKNTAKDVTVWVTDNAEVKDKTDENRLIDIVSRMTIEHGETVLIENFTLAPNERIYIDPNIIGLNVMLNGMIISADV